MVLKSLNVFHESDQPHGREMFWYVTSITFSVFQLPTTPRAEALGMVGMPRQEYARLLTVLQSASL